MADTPKELRERIVKAYLSGKSGTYSQTAAIFGVSRSTVNRILRRYRETGSFEIKARGGNNPRCIELAWLKEHAQKHPEARIFERIDDWEKASGRRVSHGAMVHAMKTIGWTYKKNAEGEGSWSS